MKTHVEQLHKLGACQEGCTFADQYATWQDCWDAIPRGDWSIWLLGKQCGPVDSSERHKLVGICAEIAREVLPFFEKRHPDDKRVRECLDVLDMYAAGKVTMDDVRKARRSAADAAYAYDAAYAAYAAYDAAYAAYAAYARKSIRKKSADIVRKHYPVAPSLS